jgi:Bax protein
MKKNLSYRDKLLELAKIYRITEIQNYIKRKKHLTNSQIEHVLKKNNVPIPKEINISSYNRLFLKPISKIKTKTNNFYLNLEKGISSTIKNLWKTIGNGALQTLNIFPKLISAVIKYSGQILINAFNSIYDPKLEIKKINQVVTVLGVVVVITSVGVIGYTVIKSFDKNKILNVKKIEKVQPEKTKLKKTENTKIKEEIKEKKLTEKKEKKPFTSKPKEEKKEIIKKTEKKPNKLNELVLPNLNLKTETVLSLFDDVEYDLKKVRYQKKVQPIYFTQFPKDLDEIKDTQLKKETFIKIVLPLVVAENEKILDDKIKLKKLSVKNKTTDKEKLWLKQKFREYKIKKSDINELKKRMDVIPVSIALAQAAKESGWGTSRFALEGNAIFGQWTWTGLGIEPLDKGKNEGHKILRFPILRASVKAYKNNLNTHNGYSEFREKRFNLRKKNRPVKGLDLIATLDNYAQTGKEYVDVLEQIIKQNSLNEFETVKLTNSAIKEVNL